MSNIARNLVLQSVENPAKRVEISSWIFVIGNGDHCDLRINHAGISDPHACIVRKNDEYTIWDISSRNGTYIIEPESLNAEHAVKPVPRVASVDDVQHVDRNNAVPLVPNMRVAFATDVWIVHSGASNSKKTVDGAAEDAGHTDVLEISENSDVDDIILEIIKGKNTGRFIPVEVLPAALGRSSSEASIVFKEAERISRLHAVISRDTHHHLVINDCESRNGTFLNGKPVSSPSRIRNGDVISLGQEISLRVSLNENAPCKKWIYATFLFVVLLLIGSVFFYQVQKPTTPIPETLPPPVVTMEDWSSFLASYEPILPEIKDELEACSLDCIQSHWNQLTNNIAQLATIFADNNDEFVDDFDSWCRNVEAGLSGRDDEIRIITDYGRLRFGQFLSRRQENQRQLFVHALDNGEFRKAQQVRRTVNSQKLVNEFWVDADKTLQGLHTLATATDLEAWLIARQELLALSLAPDLRPVVVRQIDRLEDLLIQRYRERAGQISDVKQRILMLRKAQRVKDDHVGLLADVSALRTSLEPFIRERLINATDLPAHKAQMIYREILDMTRVDDWSETYHERCRLLLGDAQ